jgi:hypothetical protein
MKVAHAPFVAVTVCATAPRTNIKVSDQALRRAPSDEPKRGRNDLSDEKPATFPFLSSALLQSIDTSNTVGPRDRNILAALIFTAACVGAVSRLTMKSLKRDGTQFFLRFSEKGGKARGIPFRRDVEQILLSAIEAAAMTEGLLFRTAIGSVRRGIRLLRFFRS